MPPKPRRRLHAFARTLDHHPAALCDEDLLRFCKGFRSDHAHWLDPIRSGRLSGTPGELGERPYRAREVQTRRTDLCVVRHR